MSAPYGVAQAPKASGASEGAPPPRASLNITLKRPLQWPIRSVEGNFPKRLFVIRIPVCLILCLPFLEALSTTVRTEYSLANQISDSFWLVTRKLNPTPLPHTGRIPTAK